jgi:hypothetical protein
MLRPPKITSTPIQNPEQSAHDTIDQLLGTSGWVRQWQDKKVIN